MPLPLFILTSTFVPDDPAALRRIIAGTLLFGVAFSIGLLTGNQFAYERFGRVQKLYVMMPVAKTAYVLGSLAHLSVVGAVSVVVLFGFAMTRGIDVRITWAIFPMLVFAVLVVMGLVLFIVSFAPSLDTANMSASTVGLFLAVMSPVYYTMEQAPLLIRWFGYVSPLRYAADGISASLSGSTDVFLRDGGAGRIRACLNGAGAVEAAPGGRRSGPRRGAGEGGLQIRPRIEYGQALGDTHLFLAGGHVGPPPAMSNRPFGGMLTGGPCCAGMGPYCPIQGGWTMAGYISRRLLLAFLTIWAISILVVHHHRVAGRRRGGQVDGLGDAAGRYVPQPGAGAVLPRVTWASTSRSYVRYVKWVWNLMRGELGYTFGDGYYASGEKPIKSVIGDRIWITIVLTGFTIIVTWSFAIPVGIYAAVRQHSVGDYVFTVLGFTGLAVPDFLLGLVLMYVGFAYFNQNVGGLFSADYVDQPWSFAKAYDLFKHLWIPAIVLGTSGTAGLIRVMRNNLLDELGRPYVVTAPRQGREVLEARAQVPGEGGDQPDGEHRGLPAAVAGGRQRDRVGGA